jgi:uncharacterized protein YceH (UPF0502 family)
MDLTAEQARVVGCLIEKAQTTPDSYPLSSNALTSACNQTTNRYPVVDYSERQVDALMMELREMKLARTVTGSGHRVGKHKHVVDEALGLDGHALAVLAALLLRGPQTLNEIATRTERYADGPQGDKAAVDAAIDRLAGRPEPLAVRLDRQPGEREPRVDQCWTLGQGNTEAAPEPMEEPHPSPAPQATPTPTLRPATPVDLESRVAALEAELATQTRRIDRLLDELGE